MAKSVNGSVIFMLALLVLGGVACQAKDLPVLQALVNPSPQVEGPLSASGFLEAEDVTIVAEVGAQIVEMSAEQGQAVQAGQVLVRLDDTLAQAQKAQAVAALAAVRAALTQTLAGPRPAGVAAAAADLERARAEWAGALQAITDTRALVANPPGLAVQIAQTEAQIKLAEQAIQQAGAEREQAAALRDLNRAGTPERDIQEQKLAAAQANVEVSKAQYDGAVAALEQLQAMRKFPADLVASLHAVESQARLAAAGVNAAEIALVAARAGATGEDVAISQANVQSAVADVALVDERLKHFHVSSPISGVVTSKLAQTGEIAKAGAPLLVVSDLSQVELVVYIPVTQIERVAPGDTARVTVDAYPGESFAAVVTRIASKAEFTPSNVQTKEDRAKLVFAVTVRAPNPAGRLKAGMPADVVFPL